MVRRCTLETAAKPGKTAPEDTAAPESGEKAPSRLTRLRRAYPWIDRLVRAGARYQNQYGDHYAAAITYFSVLALVPLLMIAFAAGGFVLGGNPELLAELRRSITQAVPNAQLSALLNGVIDSAIERAGALGLLGLLVALYSGLGWMTNLRDALTAQWTQQPSSPPFLRKTLYDLLALLGLGLAAAVSFGISAIGGGAGRFLFAVTGVERTPFAGFAFAVLSVVLSLVAGWLIGLWILARLPRQQVPMSSAVWGALFFAIGFEILKQVAVLYLGSVTRSPAGAAFGPILGLFVFANLVSRFLLFVAAWTASGSQEQSREVPPPPAPAVIRPNVSVHRRTNPFMGAGLVGIGAVLGWLFRRRPR